MLYLSVELKESDGFLLHNQLDDAVQEKYAVHTQLGDGLVFSIS